MPARPKRFATCGHVGFGEYCHRCEQVEAFEKKAADALAGKVEGNAADFAREAARLKEPSRRKFTA